MKLPGRRKGFYIQLIILSVCMIIMMGERVYASDEGKVISTVSSDGLIYIYLKNVIEIQSGSTVQIGNDICDSKSVAMAKIREMEVPMRTVMLVDNSNSIPKQKHSEIASIMKEMISQALPNEQFRIGTFSDEVTYLCEYTSEAEVAASAVDAIEYQNQDTYFSDVLHDLLVQLEDENTDCYTRVVLFSDGADDNAIGYTNAEICELVKTVGIPVYTVGIKGKNNSSELENMFAFSRASNADYFLWDDNLSADAILDELMKDADNLCIRIAPDSTLMDGSRKNILLRLITENGEKELTTSVSMPFGTSNAVEEKPEIKEEENKENTDTGSAEQNPTDTLPTITGSSDTREDVKPDRSLLYIALGLVAIAVIGIILLLLIRSRKKKISSLGEEEKEQETTSCANEKGREPGEPEVFDYDGTVRMENDGVQGMRTRPYLVLRNLDLPHLQYKAAIQNVVHIGRKDADITLDDPYVSSRHCDVILRGNLLYIKDAGSSNGTFCDNTLIHGETPIVSGGTVKIGQFRYSVELTQDVFFSV